MNKREVRVVFSIRFATLIDKDFWFTLDKHLKENEYEKKVTLNQCYIIEVDNKSVGILRYNLFWDTIPFLNLIYIDFNYHKRGIGTKAILFWEDEMQKLGHELVMTSTASLAA